MMQPDLLADSPARVAPRAASPPTTHGLPLLGALPRLLKGRLDYLVSANLGGAYGRE